MDLQDFEIRDAQIFGTARKLGAKDSPTYVTPRSLDEERQFITGIIAGFEVPAADFLVSLAFESLFEAIELYYLWLVKSKTEFVGLFEVVLVETESGV